MSSSPALPKRAFLSIGGVPLAERVKRAAAAISLVAIFAGLFAVAPHNHELIGSLFGTVELSFTGGEFLLDATVVYSALLLAYHLVAPDLGLTKSIRVFRVAGRALRNPLGIVRQGLDREDRTAVLATLLKGFFAPMMVMSLMTACVAAVAHGAEISQEVGLGISFLTLFNQHGFWVAMKTIFFVDLLIFTVGYLVESPRLKNDIRSVDPTVLGWVAALACYPPFNFVTGKILMSQVSDFPQFEDPTIHVVLNIAMLVLMAIYASASVALGLKASNLTHRGIISRGPYAVVRHPAYLCKNMAWWIGSVPALSAAFTFGVYEGVLAVASVIGWTMLYALRAITEENHLRGVDGEYAEYEKKVRYRFIPGIF
jgi:protein-S-isoprenylcysteine O-methyltransferase Ste14